MLEISYQLKQDRERRREPFVPEGRLDFGIIRTDHIFLMDYSDGEWHDPRIVPDDGLDTDAAENSYGLDVFEGTKAHKHPNGKIYTFRSDQSCLRLNHSAKTLDMPTIPEDVQLEGIHALLDVDRLWYPKGEDTSIYIRPKILATEGYFGVRSSLKYQFRIMLSPSGSYFPNGFVPIALVITDNFKRVAPKSAGNVKLAGNYANSIPHKNWAHGHGGDQVLYLDVFDRELEEAGAMNHYQVNKAGEITIPTWTDTILESITAKSFLELSQMGQLGYPVKQQRIRILDFLRDLISTEITEAGAVGTAAVVSPVGRYILGFGKAENYPSLNVGDGEIGPVTKRMYELLTGIQKGRIDPPKGWLKEVEKRS